MIAKRLVQRGVDMLAVYSPEQAEDLSTLGLPCPILVLMQVHEVNRNDLLFHAASMDRLHLTIHDPSQVKDLERSCHAVGLRIPVHVYIDTGMSRAGVSPQDAPGVIRQILYSRSLRLAGVYTHLASTDGDTSISDVQLGLYDRVLDAVGHPLPADVLFHIANTAGTVRNPRYHRKMARVGIGMYGLGIDLPDGGSAKASPAGFSAGVPSFKPVARWVSSVIHVQKYPSQAAVGYNSTYRLKRDSVLGTVPVGYADGYPLALSNLASVDLPEHSNGTQSVCVPVVGRINMDQIVIDLTDVPKAGVRTQVELFSNNPDSKCALPRLAELANSSCYELLTRLSPRLARKYVSVEVGSLTPALPRITLTKGDPANIGH